MCFNKKDEKQNLLIQLDKLVNNSNNNNNNTNICYSTLLPMLLLILKVLVINCSANPVYSVIDGMQVTGPGCDITSFKFSSLKFSLVKETFVF